MTDMSNTYSEKTLVDQMSKTQAALASIEAKKRKEEAAGYAVISGAMAYGEGSLGGGLFGRLSAASKWFCIWFAMIVPVYLFWSVMF